MSVLKEVLSEQVPAIRQRVKTLVDEHGDEKISEVSLKQIYGGMRGVKGLICDTSDVDPHEGLAVRGTPIDDLADRSPEEILFLLITGELPDESQLKALRADLAERSEIPRYVWNVLYQLPPEMHPMSMLSTVLLAMQRESYFAARHNEGVAREDYWQPVLEDLLGVIAKLPLVAGGIYRVCFGKGNPIHPGTNATYSERFAEALGVEGAGEKFADLIRLYLVLHCDHEGGNVSAHTCRTVASALSDPYLALSAGLNGLAGPLHGRANQQCLKFVLEIHEQFGGAPSTDELSDFVWSKLKEGRIIPGYGHAVLRETDPRFSVLHEFGKTHCADDEVFAIVDRLYEVVPDILKEHGHAKDPYPNVDAVSGSLLRHFGVKEMSYYTVFFAVSRAFGLLSQVLMDRIMVLPITRPKSVTTEWLEKQVSGS